MTRLPDQQQALRKRCQRIYREHKRKAGIVGITLAYDVEDLLWLASRATCEYCRMPVALDFQFDHRIPIARDGPHRIDNLVVACKRCNALKGRLTVEEFTELCAMLRRWHPAGSQDVSRRLLRGAVVYTGSRKGGSEK